MSHNIIPKEPRAGTMENFSLFLTYPQYFLDMVDVIGYNDIIRNWGKKNEMCRSYDSVFHICRRRAWSAERQTRRVSILRTSISAQELKTPFSNTPPPCCPTVVPFYSLLSRTPVIPAPYPYLLLHTIPNSTVTPNYR